jgi:hypothetical protein
MHASNTLLGLVALAAATVHAQAGATIKVSVGADGKLSYKPNNIVYNKLSSLILKPLRFIFLFTKEYFSKCKGFPLDNYSYIIIYNIYMLYYTS